jgi:hypothetical protein
MNKSESIKEIAKALCQFQAEVKNPANTANNPFFKSKYAPLQDILNLVRPLLSKHGLSILQMPSSDEGDVVITTLLMHTSGEWIETCPLKMKPVKTDPQGIGSCITYGRRYSLSAVLGISSEDDDDGNGASNGNSNNAASATNSKPQKTSKPKPDNARKTITPTQQKELFAIAKENGWTNEQVRDKMLEIFDGEVKSSGELTPKQMQILVENLPPVVDEADASEIVEPELSLDDLSEDWEKLGLEA